MKKVARSVIAVAALAAGLGAASAGDRAVAAAASSTTAAAATSATTTPERTSTDGGDGARVTVCHHTHSRRHGQHTITVGAAAVAAHVRHGDTVGACGDGTSTTPDPTGAAPPGRGHGHGGKP